MQLTLIIFLVMPRSQCTQNLLHSPPPSNMPKIACQLFLHSWHWSTACLLGSKIQARICFTSFWSLPLWNGWVWYKSKYTALTRMSNFCWRCRLFSPLFYVSKQPQESGFVPFLEHINLVGLRLPTEVYMQSRWHIDKMRKRSSFLLHEQAK